MYICQNEKKVIKNRIYFEDDSFLFVIILDTYGGPAALPAVVAGKCDSADCVTPTDITAIKSCFTDPSTNECTSKTQPAVLMII